MQQEVDLKYTRNKSNQRLCKKELYHFAISFRILFMTFDMISYDFDENVSKIWTGQKRQKMMKSHQLNPLPVSQNHESKINVRYMFAPHNRYTTAVPKIFTSTFTSLLFILYHTNNILSTNNYNIFIIIIYI